jgi:hypothetical protein
MSAWYHPAASRREGAIEHKVEDALDDALR